MKLIPCRAVLLAAVALLAGCGKVPVTTQWKLRAVDPLTFDPAAPRVAIIASNTLRALPGGAKILFRHWEKEAGDNKTTETFVLQEAGEALPAAIRSAAPEGTRMTVFRLADKDIPRVRALQVVFAERKRTAPGTTGAEVKADIDACRTADLPAGPLEGSVFIKMDEANGYLPLFERLDFRALAESGGNRLEAMVKPCPPPARR